MNIPSRQSTLKLIHLGRRSQKPYEVTIWFSLLNGELWIGSLDENRGWVRNLRGNGKARVDFGQGAHDVTVEELTSPENLAAYRAATATKYPILSRVIGLLVRGKKPVVFRLTASGPLSPTS